MRDEARRIMADLTRGRPAAEVYAEDAVWEGSHPFGRREGGEAISAVWDELRAAMPDVERRDLIVAAGANRDDPRLPGRRAPHLVAMLGHLCGTFRAPLRGIPPTHGAVFLRYGEAHWIEGGRVRRSWVILDLVDLMEQAGCSPLPRPFGAVGQWPGPATQDGLSHADWKGPDALTTVFGMHDALLSFDGSSLGSMDHARFWTPDFMYYAGGGIGTTRGLSGFRAHHQIPFLRAFPDRNSEGHWIRISDGPYAVTGGTIWGTHSAAWLGMTATGRRASMPVMDFYRIEPDGRIAENWLPIDVLGAAHGLGHDLLEGVAHRAGAPRMEL